MAKMRNRMYHNLTLILLTSTKWWAPASASKWRMGFNPAFKGLNKGTALRDMEPNSKPGKIPCTR
jgi:hypothetical protein